MTSQAINRMVTDVLWNDLCGDSDVGDIVMMVI